MHQHPGRVQHRVQEALAGSTATTASTAPSGGTWPDRTRCCTSCTTVLTRSRPSRPAPAATRRSARRTSVRGTRRRGSVVLTAERRSARRGLPAPAGPEQVPVRSAARGRAPARPGRTGGREAHAVPEQQREQVDQHLVHQTLSQALGREVAPSTPTSCRRPCLRGVQSLGQPTDDVADPPLRVVGHAVGEATTGPPSAEVSSADMPRATSSVRRPTASPGPGSGLGERSSGEPVDQLMSSPGPAVKPSATWTC